MVEQQQKLIPSPYMDIYELIIPKDNLLRQIKEIEAKNSELKHRHGYDIASSSGLICMEMQGAMTIFAVNLKRIIKLINEK